MSMALAKNIRVELAPQLCAQMNSELSKVYPSGGAIAVSSIRMGVSPRTKSFLVLPRENLLLGYQYSKVR